MLFLKISQPSVSLFNELLKGPLQPAYRARAISLLSAILVDHKRMCSQSMPVAKAPLRSLAITADERKQEFHCFI